MSAPTLRQRHGLHLVTTAAADCQRAIDAYLAARAARVAYELERAARAEAHDLLRTPATPAPSITGAAAEPIPSLLGRLVESLRAEFGFTWPAWAVLYALFVAGGVWGCVICAQAVLS